MHGIITFILAAALILGVLVIFFVILVGGWIVGTLYLWVEGAADEEPAGRQLAWWNRSNSNDSD